LLTANCPNCGAEITFRWNGAVQTTCPFCRSILVRHDLDLQKVGVVSDIPLSTSAIQLGTEGRYKGTPFVVVGRIIYEYERGRWNEWHIRLGDESAWLSDALAEYAISRQRESPSALPKAATLGVGQSFAFDGASFKVTRITTAQYAGVEGELPFEYWDKTDVTFVDLRSEGADFATLDYSDEVPALYIGKAVDFDTLRLRNVRTFEGW
jgi:hypothetical protein